MGLVQHRRYVHSGNRRDIDASSKWYDRVGHPTAYRIIVVLQAIRPYEAFSITRLFTLNHCVCSQGSYDEAAPLYQRALAIREKALGLEHPDVATSLNNIAGLFKSQVLIICYVPCVPVQMFRSHVLGTVKDALVRNIPNQNWFCLQILLTLLYTSWASQIAHRTVDQPCPAQFYEFGREKIDTVWSVHQSTPLLVAFSFCFFG